MGAAGFDRIRLDGSGDVADICRLTCLEQGIEISESNSDPLLQIHGLKIHILWDTPIVEEHSQPQH